MQAPDLFPSAPDIKPVAQDTYARSALGNQTPEEAISQPVDESAFHSPPS